MSSLADRPVFPLENQRLLEDGTLFKQHPGMTLRQHYAGQAMQGLIAADADIAYNLAAEQAVRHADALIAALEGDKK